MKRILMVCGNGITIPTVVATEIREKCEDNGISVSATQCKLLGVKSKIDDFDLSAMVRKFTGGNVSTPVVGVIFLLTGINEDATLSELPPYLK